MEFPISVCCWNWKMKYREADDRKNFPVVCNFFDG